MCEKEIKHGKAGTEKHRDGEKERKREKEYEHKLRSHPRNQVGMHIWYFASFSSDKCTQRMK